MIKQVKEIEKKLESVRKEREQVISIIEETLKRTYNSPSSHHHGYYSGNSQYPSFHNNYVGIKIYGSMASGLAIDSSDVDLAVTGLHFNGNRELHLQEMRQLQDQLEFLHCIQSMKFIESATIPVIKLQIDLQKIS